MRCLRLCSRHTRHCHRESCKKVTLKHRKVALFRETEKSTKYSGFPGFGHTIQSKAEKLLSNENRNGEWTNDAQPYKVNVTKSKISATALSTPNNNTRVST
jgi:hypothetical protein